MHIGISGPIASGKSTLAKSLQSVFELMDIRARITPFAEDLKWMASLYGSPELIPQLLQAFRILNYDEVTVWKGVAKTLEAFLLYPPVDGVKPRKLYQFIGAEMGRNTVDPELWIKAVQRRIRADKTHLYFISDDVRFYNEIQALDYHVHISIPDNAMTLYEMRKSLFPPDHFFSDHESEQEILPAADYTIPINYTVDQLIHLAKSINHFQRKNVILTQRDLPDAFSQAAVAMANFGKSFK